MNTSHEHYMTLALQLAEMAAAAGEIPVGALVVKDGVVIAKAFNTREADGNPLHHAEIKVLQMAAQHLSNWRLSDCELYVSLEPCPMCLGALLQARVKRVIFGAFDSKRKPEDYFPSLKGKDQNSQIITANNHNLEVLGGVLENESALILKDFFKNRRF